MMTNDKDNRTLSQSIVLNHHFAEMGKYADVRFQAYSINFISTECEQ